MFDQGFLDRGNLIPITVNAIRIFDVHYLFLDGGQFAALQIFQDQVISYP